MQSALQCDRWRLAGAGWQFNRSQSAIKPLCVISLSYPLLSDPLLCAFMNVCVLCACVGIDWIGIQPFWLGTWIYIDWYVIDSLTNWLWILSKFKILKNYKKHYTKLKKKTKEKGNKQYYGIGTNQGQGGKRPDKLDIPCQIQIPWITVPFWAYKK